MLWNDMFVSGTGRYLPPRASATDLVGDGTIDRQALEMSDFESFTASDGFTAAEMAASAATDALRRSGHDGADIATVIHAVFDDQEHYAPACYVQRVVGASRALAVEAGAGSCGGAAGLVLAASHLAADPSATSALVTAAGRFVAPRWPRWLPGLGHFLADGAAAAVLSRGAGQARLVATSCTAVPELEDLATPTIPAEDGSRMMTPAETVGVMPHLGMLQAAARTAVEQVLQEAGVSLDKVSRFAVTGLGLAQLTVLLLDPLGIPSDRTSWPLHRTLGHVGPCDQLLGLDHFLREESLEPSDTVLVIGIGAGFRFICALLEITG
ncbi:3-oxoacyl-[acyl-carrier-protein] synthase III C-terminal domain-containing protein [Saccharopolyspora pogona]|uniref:3-oxoacyl-[acyl-carrier-protein] synthase III C-terminal domain-containing protein n=1 Tax=Saccharopolyspora pogona TaxID=333966 RepID=UPI001682B3A9|nr:3-oxoacyl-[acyl-carrier-protein] synthase III C-terminal domain-containing protein [Saccharopolyspora pogona]